MFTILRKNFAGCINDTYFRSWDKARTQLDFNVSLTCQTLDGHITEVIDRMNADKGFYEYQVTASFPNCGTCTWALIEGHFSDEPNY